MNTCIHSDNHAHTKEVHSVGRPKRGLFSVRAADAGTGPTATVLRNPPAAGPPPQVPVVKLQQVYDLAVGEVLRYGPEDRSQATDHCQCAVALYPSRCYEIRDTGPFTLVWRVA